MALGRSLLKLLQTVLYAIEFCCAAIILGIFSYFLAVLAKNDLDIPRWQQAVEGISGAAALYLIFAVLLTCFLGGKPFFAFLAIALDVLFCGGFIAIAILTRDGANSCTGDVKTPFGDGPGEKEAPGAGDYATACRLNKVAFAVSIIGAGLFLISALIQLALGRNYQKEKRYGPSPANNYTSGTGSHWWRRNRGPRTTKEAYAAEPEYAPASESGLTGGPRDVLPEGSTNGTNASYGTGYHTAPTGTSTGNPYEYNRTPATNY
ncbi:hypothetical protein P152DRAFT_343991 [Eremomyces bilateralis CBS 781.70]|uniref:MARVEL domain-containing protein n=1 Tax=Eremomyces bilateralis CBS 781.70 TaxID=1392243 RepID=A0A6G1G3W8_9PEZI|nr:uncharacterized protein P152DRAFT_343991 [Eremomyces bilateralis CBS 781.70]KAF1812610.1 hypothetical protein P152DRAFT_343991 [Eremomyces bilateralis CBS 781.70]